MPKRKSISTATTRTGSPSSTAATAATAASSPRKSMWGSSTSSSNKKSNKQQHAYSSNDNHHYGRKSYNNNAVSMEEVEKLWNLMANHPDNTQIGASSSKPTPTPQAVVVSMEGISILCEHLNLDPLEDIRVLVLLWKMMGGVTSKPAQITKDEWIQGCERLQVDTLVKLQELIPSLEIGFLDNEEFKDFYKFCFQFNREGTHKTVDKELVIMLLQLVLKDSNRVSLERLNTFCSFLEASPDYRRITLDQWTSFWDFCQEYEDDLSAYDESTSAWPVMMDEYVEYLEKEASH